MVVVCCVCGVVIEEKEPLEDKSKSHSYCDPHYEEAMKEASQPISNQIDYKKLCINHFNTT